MSNISINLKKEELMNLFTCCDFFITLSLEDIYGHTTNEAMAKGLPVISSNKVVSSLHLIENGINGYLVNLEDHEITKALDSISLTMSQNAINTAKQNTIEAMAESHKEIFKRIIEK